MVYEKFTSKWETVVIIFIFLVSLLLFSPALGAFYTHDDFFHLKISDAKSIADFFGYFDLTKNLTGYGVYRPLSTQTFYMLAWKLYNLNPIGQRIISIVFFFILIYLVYKLAKTITENQKLSLIAAFIYSTSSTHYLQIYFLSLFQELSVAVFTLLSVILHVKYLENIKISKLILSTTCFLLALMCKETALVIPLLIILVYLLRNSHSRTLKVRRLFFSLMPIGLVIVLYVYMRIFYFGFPKGDSYVWDFSVLRSINTILWYCLWSLNIPEMLVDFVGPGLRVNYGQLTYWKYYYLAILISNFAIFFIFLENIIKIFNKKFVKIGVFCTLWFIFSLLPVMFLPWHKFSYYLTIPIMGISIFMSYLISKSKKPILYLFFLLWMISSTSNVFLLEKSYWIPNGSKISKRIYKHLKINEKYYKGHKVVFYDRDEDRDTSWQPTETIRDVLSGEDFFEVFFPELEVVYNVEPLDVNENNEYNIRSAIFIK